MLQGHHCSLKTQLEHLDVSDVTDDTSINSALVDNVHQQGRQVIII